MIEISQFMDAVKIVEGVFLENKIKKYWTLHLEYRRHSSGNIILEWVIYCGKGNGFFYNGKTFEKALSLLKKDLGKIRKGKNGKQ